jgi:hypothetical protein
MSTSPLTEPTTTSVSDRRRRSIMVLTIATVLALFGATAADGTQHDLTTPGTTEGTAIEEHDEPCTPTPQEEAEVLGTTPGTRDTPSHASPSLIVLDAATSDAVFLCRYPDLTCAL